MSNTILDRCVNRLRTLYPEPWFVWWGIGAGVHCGECMGFVRPHGNCSSSFNVTDSLLPLELLIQLEAMQEVSAEASLAQSGNYVTDNAVKPQVVWFNNGRVVRVVKESTGDVYLAVGTDFVTKDSVFF